jgi:hypothetical protein
MLRYDYHTTSKQLFFYDHIVKKFLKCSACPGPRVSSKTYYAFPYCGFDIMVTGKMEFSTKYRITGTKYVINIAE